MPRKARRGLRAKEVKESAGAGVERIAQEKEEASRARARRRLCHQGGGRNRKQTDGAAVRIHQDTGRREDGNSGVRKPGARHAQGTCIGESSGTHVGNRRMYKALRSQMMSVSA